MLRTISHFLDRIRRWLTPRRRPSGEAVSRLFRYRYSCFKDLLASNTEALNIITDLEEKLRGQEIFGMSYVRSQASRAVFHILRMVKSLDDLSGHRYRSLFEVVERVNREIKEELDRRKEIPISDLILPYSRVTKEMVDWVGGKNANIGELLNRVGVPVPRGFAITTLAYEFFVDDNDLLDEIARVNMDLDPSDPGTINAVSERIQALIGSARVPARLESAIDEAYRTMAQGAGRTPGTSGSSPRVALRSSAVGEDSDLSYAGQYLSVLNVPGERIVATYKDIVASLYNPRAISYRLSKGMRAEDVAMSVACMEMVESVASGVVYSRHPSRLWEDLILITSVWGLGPYIMDGIITPDSYVVAKSGGREIVETKISKKPVQLVLDPLGGTRQVPVEERLQTQACLSPEQVRILADHAIELEKHHEYPQDIEWTLDPAGGLVILQTRPLHVTRGGVNGAKALPQLEGYRVLIGDGAVAFPGVGKGPAFHVRSDEDLLRFPEGAVLVASHSSPQFVIAMPRAQAIVTDAGSVTGHMASLAREFGIPTILDAKCATGNIPPGCEVTVDAYSGRVYEGCVAELLALRRPRESVMKDTPVHQTLRRVGDRIVPLNLVDPRASSFAPESCRTLHDVLRLVHELSYKEMFQTSDLVSDTAGAGAFKLTAPIRLDLYIIDIGQALREDARESRLVGVDQVLSLPLRALLTCPLHEALRVQGPRPVDLGGFLSVMAEQMASPADLGERFGDRSYAIASDSYLNFSSRIGYHYSVLDTYCTDTINKNYLTFFFKGGAADDTRKHRRVRAIAHILERLGFAVEAREDRVDARFYKHERSLVEEKLDMVGRMLQFTRQMDMLMRSEASVKALAERFLSGVYDLDDRFWASLEPGSRKPDRGE
ncbi:MAG: phosphoenolpyruvate synthase [Candidatus Riflebacteria bacterium]|nr:phosphoenolpyruvate synthase [Candidatus Riflebacteria bacterium]